MSYELVCLPDDNAKILPPESAMSLNVRQCPQMSLNVLIK